MAFTQVGIEAVVKGLGQFTQGTQTIRRQMGLTGSAALRASGQSQGLNQSLTQTGQSVRNFGNQVLILGFQLTFLASGAMVSVINQAAQFEKEMTKINTLVGVSQEQVGEWSDELLNLGPALGQTPRDLAEALFFITSAGIRDSTESLEVLESAAQASAIGMGEVKDVANATTSVLQAYASTGITASEATDILTATVREGKTQAEELAPSIGRVIPLASQMGVSFEEVGAFIATFTRLGVPASVAVTSLRSALTAILKPSGAAKDALEEYGLTMDNVRQTIDEQGLAAALIQLALILGDDDEAFGKIIGSARGLSGVLAVTGDLSESYVEILNNLENSAGITAQGFETVSKTTAFLADQAKASAQVVAISFGQVLLPGINEVLKVLSSLLVQISTLAETSPDLIKVVGVIAAFITILGPLLIISGLVISSIGTLITAIGALGGVLLSFLSIPALIISALGGIGLAIGGSLVAGFIEARRQSEESATQFAFRAFFWGENIILSFAEGMASAINAVIDVLIQLGNAIANWLQALSPPRLLPKIDEWGKETMQAWLDGFLLVDFSIFNELSDKLEGFIRSLSLDETRVVPTIREMRDALLDVIHTFDETGKISQEAINSVTSAIGKNNAVLKEYIKTFLELEIATRAVAEAQAELNEINIRFDNLLDPIISELEQISRIRQETVDALRIAELEEILADPRATEQVRELARLELREIALKKQQGALEDQRDAELDVVNARLEAAKAEQELLQSRLDSLDAIITAQTKENQLINEQLKLLERLAKAAERAAKAGEFKGIPGGLPGTPKPEDVIEEALTAAQQRLAEKLGIGAEPGPDSISGKILFAFNRLKDKIIEIFKPTTAQLRELGKAWAPIVTFIIDGVLDQDLSDVDPSDRKFFTSFGGSLERGFEDSTITQRVATVLEGILANAFEMAIVGAIGRIKIDAPKLGQAIKLGFERIFLAGLGEGEGPSLFEDLFLNQLTLDPITFTNVITERLTGIDFLGPFTRFLEDQLGMEISSETLAGLFGQFFVNLPTIMGDIIEGAFEDVGLNIQPLRDLREEVLGAVDALGLLIGGQAVGGAPSGLLGFGGVMPGLGTIVQAFVNTELKNLRESLGEAESFIREDLVPSLEEKLDGAMKTVGEAFDGVSDTIENIWDAAIEGVDSFINDELLGTIQDLIDILFGEGTANSLGATITRLVTTVVDKLTTAFDNVKGAAGRFLTKIQELWTFVTTRNWSDIIPWPLREDSPSPYTLSLTNASDATEKLIDSMSKLNAVDLGRAATTGLANGALLSNVPVQPSSTVNNNTINLGGQTFSREFEQAQFQIMVEQALRRVVG